MTLSQETIIFLTFVLIGMLFSIIFDVFRAIRKIKKTNIRIICIQDIIYFILIGIILIITIINFMDSEIRAYLVLAIVLGAIIYISVFGNFIRNVFASIFRINGKIIDFLILPIKLYLTLFESKINILRKIVVKCCKKISYMVNLNHIIEKFRKQKRIV